MSKPPDLTNQRFGKLVALRCLGLVPTKRGNRTMWECRCRCGKTIQNEASVIKKRTSCGCGRRDQGSPGRPSKKEEDLIGKRFGKLIVICKAGFKRVSSGKSRSFWKCNCDCGKTVELPSSYFSENLKSCGCLREEKKNENRKHEEHPIWLAMKARCYNPKCWAYPLYGGRGIIVCDEWFNNFQNFLKDMGPRPEKMSLERIDNEGDYCPENCIWADLHTQSRNRRSNVHVNVNGVSMCLTDACNLIRVNVQKVRWRRKQDDLTSQEAFDFYKDMDEEKVVKKTWI